MPLRCEDCDINHLTPVCQVTPRSPNTSLSFHTHIKSVSDISLFAQVRQNVTSLNREITTFREKDERAEPEFTSGLQDLTLIFSTSYQTTN